MQSKVDATFRFYDMRLKSNTFSFPKRGLLPVAVPMARLRGLGMGRVSHTSAQDR